MDQEVVARVRRFQRTVTERVGALDDHFLARDRSLGESRLLWEIGVDGRDVRALRAGLGIDSGYLSRLLRSLETAGLVRVGPREDDRRVRRVRLTAAGRTERHLLDRRSDTAAADLLAPLTPAQQQRLVTAMDDVERLLTVGLVEIAAGDPADTDARCCLAQYFRELDARFDAGFDPERSIPADDDELRPPAGLLLVARLRGEPVGCVALKLHGGAPGELKRMWVGGGVRGLGLGRRLLAEAERHAADHGVRILRLETNASLVEAIALYRSAGYTEVSAFNDEAYADHWFEKRLGPSPVNGGRGRPARPPR